MAGVPAYLHCLAIRLVGEPDRRLSRDCYTLTSTGIKELLGLRNMGWLSVPPNTVSGTGACHRVYPSRRNRNSVTRVGESPDQTPSLIRGIGNLGSSTDLTKTPRSGSITSMITLVVSMFGGSGDRHVDVST